MTRYVIPTTRRITDRGAVWLGIAAISALWAAVVAWMVLS